MSAVAEARERAEAAAAELAAAEGRERELHRLRSAVDSMERRVAGLEKGTGISRAEARAMAATPRDGTGYAGGAGELVRAVQQLDKEAAALAALEEAA